MVQVALAAVGVVITGINAWPNISQFQLFSVAPIIFYLVLAVAAISFVGFATKPHLKKISAGDAIQGNEDLVALSARLLSADAVPLMVETATNSITLTKGSLWTAGSDLHAIKLTYHNLVTEGDLQRAEIEVYASSNFAGGSLTKTISAGHRFLMPATSSQHGSEQRSIFSFSFSKGVVRFDLIRVSQINALSGEIQITICRGSGYKRI